VSMLGAKKVGRGIGCWVWASVEFRPIYSPAHLQRPLHVQALACDRPAHPAQCPVPTFPITVMHSLNVSAPPVSSSQLSIFVSEPILISPHSCPQSSKRLQRHPDPISEPAKICEEILKVLSQAPHSFCGIR
jgi:hypothetical protein